MLANLRIIGKVDLFSWVEISGKEQFPCTYSYNFNQKSKESLLRMDKSNNAVNIRYPTPLEKAEISNIYWAATKSQVLWWNYLHNFI